MIDTVILSVPREKIKTINDNKFPKWHLHSTGKGYCKRIKNTSEDELNMGLSSVKLTGFTQSNSSKKFKQGVNIEFSVPKLIKGDNLNEVEELDFPLIVKTLQERLKNMGEIISQKNLESATVSAFHPSKNIILSDGYTASAVIKELSKINVSKKFDKTDVVFSNDGSSLQIRTQSHSIVFYDKLADIIKDKKKAIDKNPSQYQKSLFTEIKNKMPLLEILRFEVRLSSKRKMKEVMKKMNFTERPVFRDIIKRDVCQKIVSWYWEEIIKGENLFLFELINSPKRLIRKIVKENMSIKGKQAIFLVGLSILSKDEGGIRELRDILSRCTKQRSWYRLADDIKILNKISNKQSLHSWVQQIDQTIKSFDPLRIKVNN
ncbi:MAG: hypothetical protein WC827_04185 [Candidatus Paceibacterota bacterium]|jgi:hypothetical protein